MDGAGFTLLPNVADAETVARLVPVDMLQTSPAAAAAEKAVAKYVRIVAKIGLRPEHATLHAMSVDELRFLLRKNGTISHNVLKTPLVRLACPTPFQILASNPLCVFRVQNSDSAVGFGCTGEHPGADRPHHRPQAHG